PAPHLEKMPDSLCPHPFTDFGMILRVLSRRRRDSVIQRDCNALRSDDSLRASFLEDASDCRRIVMAEDQIRLDVQHVTRTRRLHARRPRQSFFGKGVAAHMPTPTAASINSASTCSNVSGCVSAC